MRAKVRPHAGQRGLSGLARDLVALALSKVYWEHSETCMETRYSIGHDSPLPGWNWVAAGQGNERELGHEKTSVTHETWTTRARVTEHSQRGLSRGANAYLVSPWFWLASLDAMMSPYTERALIVVDPSHTLKDNEGLDVTST